VFAEHGGEAEYGYFKDGIAGVFLRGACGTCQSSAASIQVGLNRLLQAYFKERYKAIRVLNPIGS